MCLVVTCWERADLLALGCDVQLWVCYFPFSILGQVWYLIVSIAIFAPLLTLKVLRSEDKQLTINVFLSTINIQL